MDNLPHSKYVIVFVEFQPNKSCYNESMVSKTQHINPGCDVLPKRRHSCINVPTITHLQNTLEVWNSRNRVAKILFL